MRLFYCVFLFFLHFNEILALTFEEADIRKNQISNLSYDLFINLSESDNDFSGKVNINFIFTSYKNNPLMIDFFKGKITNILINGTEVKTYSYNQKSLLIDQAFLRLNSSNSIEIYFTHSFSKGFNSYIDPIDHNRYIYSDFEPFNANKMFPLFDQPNLKGSFILQVLVPKDFQVISTMRESEIIPAKRNNNSLWIFPKTLPISSYVFSLHAGHYVQWEDQYKNVPLRLFARESLAHKVRYKEFFRYTKFALDFFENYFKISYPFFKYDQILAPRFEWEGMENVGAVTLNENLISPKNNSLNHIYQLASTIIHEAAHMWTSNLVSMNWWDDLWFNEGFTLFMQFLALSNLPQFEGKIWKHFDKIYSKYTFSSHHDFFVNDVLDVEKIFASDDIYAVGALRIKKIHSQFGDESFKFISNKYLKMKQFEYSPSDLFFTLLEEYRSSESYN